MPLIYTLSDKKTDYMSVFLFLFFALILLNITIHSPVA